MVKEEILNHVMNNEWSHPYLIICMVMLRILTLSWDVWPVCWPGVGVNLSPPFIFRTRDLEGIWQVRWSGWWWGGKLKTRPVWCTSILLEAYLHIGVQVSRWRIAESNMLLAKTFLCPVWLSNHTQGERHALPEAKSGATIPSRCWPMNAATTSAETNCSDWER